MGTPVSSSTVPITDATVALVRSIDHRGRGGTLDTLSRTGSQFVDCCLYVIGSKRLCDDGVVVGGDEGALCVCWTMAEFAANAEGRSTEG